MSKETERLIEKSRKLTEQRRQNLIDQIGRFERLDVDAWKAKVDDDAVAYDTGHNDEHGATGAVAVVSSKHAMLIDYVWDAKVSLKRWISLRVMDGEAIPQMRPSGTVAASG